MEQNTGNTGILAFYDYFRYAISMAQEKLPAAVIEDITNRLMQYIDVLTKEELESVEKSLILYEDYYTNRCHIVKELNKGIDANQFSNEIKSVFAQHLGDMALQLEKLEAVRDFMRGVNIIIAKRVNSLGDVKKSLG